MRRVWRGFERVEEYLANAGGGIAAVCIVSMVVVVSITAVGRYLFEFNIPNVDEFSGYGLVFMTYLGLAYGLRTGSHICIEVVRSRLPKGVADGLWVAACFIALFVIGIYFYFALDTLLKSIRVGELAITPSETPLWIPRSAICVGWIFLGMSMVHLLVTKVSEFKKPARMTNSG